MNKKERALRGIERIRDRLKRGKVWIWLHDVDHSTEIAKETSKFYGKK